MTTRFFTFSPKFRRAWETSACLHIWRRKKRIESIPKLSLQRCGSVIYLSLSPGQIGTSAFLLLITKARSLFCVQIGKFEPSSKHCSTSFPSLIFKKNNFHFFALIFARELLTRAESACARCWTWSQQSTQSLSINSTLIQTHGSFFSDPSGKMDFFFQSMRVNSWINTCIFMNCVKAIPSMSLFINWLTSVRGAV